MVSSTLNSLPTLLPGAYPRLQHMAHHLLSTRGGADFEAPELVHEVYLKLSMSSMAHALNDTQHLLAVSFHVMQQILVDHERKQQTQKRGGSWTRVDFAHLHAPQTPDFSTPLDVNAALQRLSQDDERLAQVAKYRLIDQLPLKEIARRMMTSMRTVERLWKRARLYLRRLWSSTEYMA